MIIIMTTTTKANKTKKICSPELYISVFTQSKLYHCRDRLAITSLIGV